MRKQIQALGRLKTGQMNKTESAYCQHLELRKRAGEIVWYRFEGIKLRLADNTFYTPDFAVMLATGENARRGNATEYHHGLKEFVIMSFDLISKPQPPTLSWLKLNAKQSASSLTALNTSCVTSCLRMTPKRCLRLCVFFWKNRVVSKNDNHKTTGRRNHIPH